MVALLAIVYIINDESFAMSSTRPIRITALRGRVTQGRYGKGSKSEREAFFLETTDARYILRLKTGSVFDNYKTLHYLGHEIECDGFLVGTTVLAERIELID